jgi:diguanylate cyclase (GGDEF)-like protein
MIDVSIAARSNVRMISLSAVPALFDAIPYPVFAKDSQHRWIYGNAAFSELMGGIDFVGKSDKDIFPPDQVKVFWEEDDRVLAGEDSLNEEQIGDDMFALTRKARVQLEDGSFGLVGIIIASATTIETLESVQANFEERLAESRDSLNDLRRKTSQTQADLQAKLREAEASHATAILASHTDVATGLKNRLGFDVDLAEAIQDSHKNDRKLCVSFLDLDRFKHINDRYGHAVGDTVLAVIGRRLQKIPLACSVGRLGGDEFAILVDHTELPREELNYQSERSRQFVFRDIYANGKRIAISGSLGQSVYLEDAMSAEELMRNADMALMTAKRDGKGCTRVFDAEIHAKVRRRRSIEDELPIAIKKHNFTPVYQPIVCGNARVMKGVEVLARWDHPELGAVTPSEFIEVAHDAGLISDIDTAIRATAFAEVHDWLRSGEIGFVSVNVSPSDIISSDFSRRFLAQLKSCGIPPNQICLEVIESSIINDLQSARRNLTLLSEAGVSIALDDYGTGFSNLRALLDLPLDKLKIDRSLIEDIDTHQRMVDLLASIMQLAATLDVKVVAEGVETDVQAALVEEAGCHLMQGYLFSRPLKYAQMQAYLQEYNSQAA